MEKRIYVKAQMRTIDVNVQTSLLASSGLTLNNTTSASSNAAVESKANPVAIGSMWSYE